MRARDRRDVEEQKRAEQAKRANDAYDTYQSSIAKYNDLQSFVNNPRRFLLEKLDAATSKLVFPEGPKPSKGDRPDLGQEIYRSAMGLATAGAERTRNPVISTIQVEMLRKLDTDFQNIFAELDTVALSIQRFGQSELGSARPPATPTVATSRPLTPSPDPALQRRPESSDCIYNREGLKTYLANCEGFDRCQNRGQMEAIVASSCPQ
jgi:hypothetical protein